MEFVQELVDDLRQLFKVNFPPLGQGYAGLDTSFRQ